MAKAKKKKRKGKLTPHQKAFGTASKTCFGTTQNWKEFGRCMRSELKSR